jgi:hypothetical protein
MFRKRGNLKFINKDGFSHVLSRFFSSSLLPFNFCIFSWNGLLLFDFSTFLNERLFEILYFFPRNLTGNEFVLEYLCFLSHDSLYPHLKKINKENGFSISDFFKLIIILKILRSFLNFIHKLKTQQIIIF